jgi:hypothetical protein
MRSPGALESDQHRADDDDDQAVAGDVDAHGGSHRLVVADQTPRSTGSPDHQPGDAEDEVSSPSRSLRDCAG